MAAASREQAVADAPFPELDRLRLRRSRGDTGLSAGERQRVILPIVVRVQSPLVVERLNRVGCLRVTPNLLRSGTLPDRPTEAPLRAPNDPKRK